VCVNYKNIFYIILFFEETKMKYVDPKAWKFQHMKCLAEKPGDKI